MKTLRSASFWTAMLLTIFAIAPLLRPGYFWAAHDARHDVFFILQYNITWNEGILFPRWSPDWAFGYGYPFFNIYAPGATFLGALLYRTLHLTLENAVKATFIATLLISAWAMWLFVRDWLGERAALVAAVAFVYVPYHLVDVYVRAAMAESLALALLPLSLWALRRAVHRPNAINVVLVALTYAAIHLSSNLVALLFTPVLGLYLLVLIWQRAGATHLWPRSRHRASARPAARPGDARSWAGGASHLLAPAAGLALGVALAAFFILPALAEKNFVNLSQWYGGYYDFHEHFVYFAQLFDPRWGFGISTPGPDDSLSYQLGLALFALAALAAWAWLRPSGKERTEIGFWLLILLGGVWLTTGASAFAWDHVPMVSMAQFPWRYLTLAALSLAILAPVVLVLVDKKGAEAGNWLTPLLLAGLIILASSPYLRIQVTDPPPGGATLAGLMTFERTSDEMTGMTSTAEEIATWSPIADLHMTGTPVTTQVDYGLVEANPHLAVDAREHSVTSETVWVWTDAPDQRVPFYRQWYPGWTATIMDPNTGQVLQRFALTPDDTRPPYGLLDVPVPEGEHLLRISFENTPIRKIGNAISILTIILLLGLVGWGGYRYVRRKDRDAQHDSMTDKLSGLHEHVWQKPTDQWLEEERKSWDE